MDRNSVSAFDVLTISVALRKESVDRNLLGRFWCLFGLWSLSARRAWIEIVITAMTSQISVVALRKESVDRNCRYSARCVGLLSSLSARRAWIEMPGFWRITPEK